MTTAHDARDITWPEMTDAGLDIDRVTRQRMDIGGYEYVAISADGLTRVAFGPTVDVDLVGDPTTTTAGRSRRTSWSTSTGMTRSPSGIPTPALSLSPSVGCSVRPVASTDPRVINPDGRTGSQHFFGIGRNGRFVEARARKATSSRLGTDVVTVGGQRGRVWSRSDRSREWWVILDGTQTAVRVHEDRML